MSNEREPLLPDSRMYLSVPTDQAQPDGSIVPGVTKYPLMSAGLVRDYYESLITSGKLRVVEEVELVPNGSTDDENGSVIPLHAHRNCPGGYHEIRGYEDSAEIDAKFCPGCGNPIKHPSPADQVEKRG